jgi:hypothetical protein
MPIDDHRPRPPARPVIDEADDDTADIDHGGEPNPTPERLAEIEAAWIAESVRRLQEYKEGRVQGIPWEDLEQELFGPPTPEELAEDAAQQRSARARR